MAPLTPPEDFYNDLADIYDSMTEFPRRVEKEAQILKPLVTEFGIRSAVDMGCGTGVHAIGLSKLGAHVTGFDISEKMLTLARVHAETLGSSAQFEHGDFNSEKLPAQAPIDTIFCLGNSLPHIEHRKNLFSVLSFWRGLLTKGGRVILQLLNYDRMLKMHERIVGIRKEGATTIIRFYDFTEPRITFNILTVSEKQAHLEHSLRSTLLTPFTLDEISSSAKAAGFVEIQPYASLDRSPYHMNRKDLVLIMQ